MLKKTAIAFILTTMILLSYAENKLDISGGWVLSEKWSGYMGVAILFDKDEYTYWGYSDVNYPGKPRYPVTGKYSIEGNKITLDNTQDLYSNKWYIIDYQDERCLIPQEEYSKLAEGKPFDDSRLLHFDEFFDTEAPFAYQTGIYNTAESRTQYAKFRKLKKQGLEFMINVDRHVKKILDEFNASEDSKKLGGPFSVDDYKKTVVREKYDFDLSDIVDTVSYTLKKTVEFEGFPRDFSIKVYRDDDGKPHYKLVKGKLN